MSGTKSSSRFAYVARRVLTSPVALVVLAASVGIAITTGTWYPLPVAAAFEAFLLFRALHDEDYLRKLFEQRDERATALTEQQVEELLEQMDFETRQRVRYLLQLQKEIMREARAQDVQSYARAELERITAAIPELVQRAVQIATRKQQLARYLAHVDERALRGYAQGLRQRIDSTTDSVSRAQYERALQAREAELQTYRAIAQAAGRIDSQLENVEATVASWKAKVIRLKTLDMASLASVGADLFQEMEGLTREIDLLDSSVTEALAGDEPAALNAGVR